MIGVNKMFVKYIFGCPLQEHIYELEDNIDELADTSQGSRMRDLQARFYQYYAYFSNVLAPGVDTPVRQALAFIFINFFSTRGSIDIKGITGIVPNSEINV